MFLFGGANPEDQNADVSDKLLGFDNGCFMENFVSRKPTISSTNDFEDSSC